MKPVLTILLGLSLVSASSAALAEGYGGVAGGFQKLSGTFKPSGGTFGSAQPSRFGAPKIYGAPAPVQPPRAPSAPATVGDDRFTPFKGTSVYSNRGGVNAYQPPAKPKGFIDPSKRGVF